MAYPGKKTVSVDFDGVIHEYMSKWKGDAVIEDGPVDTDDYNAIEWLYSLVEHFEVVITSSRARSPEGQAAIREWLIKYDAPPDLEVTGIKPAAIVYIDDRALQFDGKNFPSADEIAAFMPWNRRAWEKL